jgi:hypothetical protein
MQFMIEIPVKKLKWPSQSQVSPTMIQPVMGLISEKQFVDELLYTT